MFAVYKNFLKANEIENTRPFRKISLMSHENMKTFWKKTRLS